MTSEVTGSLADRFRALRTRMQAETPLRVLPHDDELLARVEAMVRTFESLVGRPGEERVIEMETIVSRDTGQAKLNVRIHDQYLQLSPTKAREIAWMLLEGAAIGEADAMLTRFVKERIGLDDGRAAALLADCRAYRQEAPHDGPPASAQL